MPIVYYAYYTPASSIPAVTVQEHELGRRLLVKGLQDIYDISIPLDQIEESLSVAPNNKPYLTQFPHIHFNISHCDGLVACAFHSNMIGVDSEKPGYFPEVLINKVLSETEKSLLQRKGTNLSLKQEWFYRLWTLKEAYVKRNGVGVDTDLKGFSFSFQECDGHQDIRCSHENIQCYQVQLPQGHILSLCYEKNNGEDVILAEML